ncbi:MAG: flagellar hook-length control protein FliK [Parvularculaceae bacterium]
MVEFAVVGHVKINAEIAEKKPATARGGDANRPVSETFAFLFARNGPGDTRTTVDDLEGEKPGRPAQNKGIKLTDKDSEEAPQAVTIAAESPLARVRPTEPATKRDAIVDSIELHPNVHPVAAVSVPFQLAATAEEADINSDTLRTPSPLNTTLLGAAPNPRASTKETPHTLVADSAGDSRSAASHISAISAVDPATADTRVNPEPAVLEPVDASAAQVEAALAPIATSPASTVLDSAVELVIAAADPLSPAIRNVDTGIRLAPLPGFVPAQGRSPPAFEIASVGPRDGGGIELRLDPPELGAVTIQFFEDDAGALRASVAADKAETLDLLRRNADALHRELARHGAGEFLLSFSQRRDDSGRNNAASAHPFRIAQTPSALVETRLPEAMLARASGIDLIA